MLCRTFRSCLLTGSARGQPCQLSRSQLLHWEVRAAAAAQASSASWSALTARSHLRRRRTPTSSRGALQARGTAGTIPSTADMLVWQQPRQAHTNGHVYKLFNILIFLTPIKMVWNSKFWTALKKWENKKIHSTLLFDRLRPVKAKLKHEPFRGLPRVSAVHCGKTLQNYIFDWIDKWIDRTIRECLKSETFKKCNDWYKCWNGRELDRTFGSKLKCHDLYGGIQMPSLRCIFDPPSFNVWFNMRI